MKIRFNVLSVLLVFGVLFPLLSFGSGRVEFDIQPRLLRVGEAADCTFTVRGVDDPPPPPLRPIAGLQIAGPSRQHSTQVSIVNGQMRQDKSVSFSYRLVPLQTGVFAVGPFSYSLPGEVIDIPRVEISVVDLAGEQVGGAVAQTNRPRLWAQMKVEKRQIYSQETFDLVVAIYARGLRIGGNVELLDMPTAGLSWGLFEELAPEREVIDNEVYEVRRFRSKVRALTAGEFRLAPLLRVPVVLPRERSRRHSFFDDPFFDVFNGPALEPLEVRPEPLSLVVRPLPENGRPVEFSGGVGQFIFGVDVKPTDVEVGEPVTVNVVISGSGNIDSVKPPEYRESDDFKVYEMRREENDVDQAKAVGRKVFEQVVIPKRAGDLALPGLSFAFFNTEAGDYQAVTKGPFPLRVRPAAEGKSGARVMQPLSKDRAAREVPEDLGADIVYLKTGPAVWRQGFYGGLPESQLFWFGQLVPLAGVVLSLWLLRRRQDLRVNVAKARRQRAPQRARAGLQRAQAGLAAGGRREFFEGVWEALAAYFGDRLNLAPGEVTTELVLAALAKTSLDLAAREGLVAIFRVCDEERFGGGGREADWAGILSEVPRLLKLCEKVEL